MIPAVVRRAESSREIVVMRNNRPVAAIIGMERLDELQRAQDDLMDLALATARIIASPAGGELRLDAVLDRFGVTRDQLDALED